jgi:murein DD-endopeptidase MepM/ murein hydrolase activator NlpD
MSWIYSRKHLLWIVPLLILDGVILLRLARRPGGRAAPPAAAAPAAARASPWKTFAYPTDQRALLDPDAPTAGVFQPTASGKPDSALFGSVRTAAGNGGLRASFHEGVDIAAMKRDRRGAPLDEVRAAADGKVGYVNRVRGNSNYGLYVVLLHDDAAGEAYTLYAHLARVAPHVRPGHRVRAGDVIGVMGNTSSSPIPVERAHLHFEVGLMCNARFAAWYRAKKLKPFHDRFHGWNFLGVNPLEFLAAQRANPDLGFHGFLRSETPSFEILLPARRLPDFFLRHPALWEGSAYGGGPVLLACAENGLPLFGRNATEEERRLLGSKRALVKTVDELRLGRNGCRIVVAGRDGWTLGAGGERWAEILLF